MILYRGYKEGQKIATGSDFCSTFADRAKSPEQRERFIQKNRAQLFFYAISKEWALTYGDVLTEWECPDYLNILDLRTEEGQRKVAHLYHHVIFKHAYATIENNTFCLPLTAKKSERKSLELGIERAKAVLAEKVLTKEGLSLLNRQSTTDYDNGVIMKKYLIENGYDGVVFDEDCDVTICLLNSAKRVS